jgi:hypothetical protein
MIGQTVDVLERGCAERARQGNPASSTIPRSARRQTVRATCSAAAAAEPPGKTKDRNGASSAFMASISSSRR